MFELEITESAESDLDQITDQNCNEFDIAIVICDNTTMHKIFSSLSIIALSGAMFAADVNVQTLSAADDLAAAVAVAKAAYQETKNAQEIVLSDGVYKTTAELMLDFPVAIRGGSGDPAKVTVEAQAVKNAQVYRVFTLNHSEARVESVTVTGGRLTRYGGSNYYNYGAGIRIAASRASVIQRSLGVTSRILPKRKPCKST